MITQTTAIMLFVSYWINDENIRKYESIVFTTPSLKHDLSDYTTSQEFNLKKILPADSNAESNEYAIIFKEYIHNLSNGRDNYVNNYVNYVIA